MKKLAFGWFLALSLGLVACGGAGGVVGKYALDKDSMIKASLEQAGAGKAEGADLDKMKQMISSMVDSMKIELEIKSDNTFTTSATMPKMPGMDAGGVKKTDGTWKQEGEEIVFTDVNEDGKKKDKPETKRAKYKGGVLSIDAGPMKIAMKKI